MNFLRRLVICPGMVRETDTVRDRLLQAGVTVFSRTGFNGSSVQDITEQAGVPKGSFYNHFNSKEMLGVAAIEHFWEGEISRLLAILDQDEVAPLERLRAYFEQVGGEIAARDFKCGCLIGNMTAELSDHSAAISDQLSAIYAKWTRRIAGTIAQAQADGAITTTADPNVLATFALNAWEGALLRARVERSARPIEQFTQTLFTHLLR